jgi:penicillin-binding protein 1A
MSEQTQNAVGGTEASPYHSDPRVGLQGFALLLVAIVSLPLYLALVAGLKGLGHLEASTRRKAVRAFGLVLIGVLAVGAVGTYVVLYGGPFPDLAALTDNAPPTIGRIDDANGGLLAELALEYRRPVDAQTLPPVLQNALLAAEDKRFFEHDGVDLTAFPRIVGKAVAASYRSRHLALPQGGSTLTMQLVRIVFLRNWTAAENGPVALSDTWLDRMAGAVVGIPTANKLHRKLEEIRLALWLERALGRQLGSQQLAKQEILRRYAAYVYLGDGRYGFAAAAEHYFSRPLASFAAKDAAEAALLAGIPKSPGRYAPSEANLDRCLRRRNLVLRLMRERDYLTDRDELRYAALPVALPSPPTFAAAAGHASAVHTVLDALKNAGDSRVSTQALLEGRIRLRSSVDRRVQALLNDALEQGLKAYEQRHPASRGTIQGSAVVLANADARILALAGGRQVFLDKPTSCNDLNRVTDSRRQPGSAMKPIAYLAAFRHGADLDTEVLDAPIAVPMGRGREPKWINNYDSTFEGWIPIRRALAESRNAATIRVVTNVGIAAVVKVAHDLGIHSKLQPYVTTGLGASEVTLLELANAYRTLASGLHAEPWILERVATTDGLELYRHSDASQRPLQDPSLALIQEGLRGVVRLPGATAHSLASLSVPVMGKTGTTSDFRDALFVGSTFGPTGVTIAVRIGFDDNRSLGQGETGGRVALPIFRSLIEHVYQAQLLGPAPRFPDALEHSIDAYMSLAPPGEPQLASAAPPDRMPADVAAVVPAVNLGSGPAEAILVSAVQRAPQP